MVETKEVFTKWHPEERLIETQISGLVDKTDIEEWQRSLQETLEGLEENSVFKIFVNLFGFKAVNFEAHKQFRTIIPSTLVQYGWKVGYVALFDEAADLPLTKERGITCVAAVHVHQDETKIALYDSNFGSPQERFFTDPQQAEVWIREIKI